MKSTRKLLLILTIIFSLGNSLFAKPTQLAKDVKKALNSYAGLSELKKRGFNLKSLDTAESGEDIYNALLPYMVQDGIPLDNLFGFYTKQPYINYNFRQHYTVHFTDDYGTKEQLLQKGYKEEEIFAYFSRGQNVYRGGNFSWEKAKNYLEIGQRQSPLLPPITGNNYIYFLPFYWSDQFYPDYWKQAEEKEYIILDLRFDKSGDYSISLFLDYLEKVNYKGQILILIDSEGITGELLLTYRMTKWSNGQEIPRELTITSIGENTPGAQSFKNFKSYETDQIRIYSVGKEKNKWKKFEEGVGVMPDIWAETPEEIFKTVEVITGIKDFYKEVETYQKFVNILKKNLESIGYNIQFPMFISNQKDDKKFIESLSKYLPLYEQYVENKLKRTKCNKYFPDPSDSIAQIQDEASFMEYFSKYVQLQTNWYDFCLENLEKRSAIRDNWRFTSNNLSLEQYFAELENQYEKWLSQSIKAIQDLKGDDYIEFLASKIEFNSDVKKENRQLESLFTIYNKYDVLKSEGFDIHKMDYMTTPEEILNYIQPFFLSPEGYPRDLHTGFTISTNEGKYYNLKQTTRFIVFNDEYGTKQQLAKKGYVENVTMFYYPYHDGKFWKNEKNWRTGRQIMAMNNYQYQQTDYTQIYYTTEKSVYFKFMHFPHPVKNGEQVGPEIEDEQLEEMIVRLSNEKGKENVIFDVSKNTGGDGYTSNRIAEAVKKAGIKNVYIVIDKWAFSCGDHFPLCANDYFSQCNVTLVGYPTQGGTGSGDMENYIINFPDFQINADIATLYVRSETEHEGWGATPDVYADDMTDALGVIRALTGDNDIKPFESEERKEFNKGKKRWREDDVIYEIKD